MEASLVFCFFFRVIFFLFIPPSVFPGTFVGRSSPYRSLSRWKTSPSPSPFSLCAPWMRDRKNKRGKDKERVHFDTKAGVPLPGSLGERENEKNIFRGRRREKGIVPFFLTLCKCVYVCASSCVTNKRNWMPVQSVYSDWKKKKKKQTHLNLTLAYNPHIHKHAVMHTTI